MLTGGLPFSISLPIDQCVVPQGINGQVAIWITSDDQPLNGNAVQRQSNAIVAGPLLTFIDIEVDELSETIRSSGKSSSSDSGYSKGSDSGYNKGSSGDSSKGSSGVSSFASTTTVPASQASSLISSLSASASPAPTGPAGAIANGSSPSPSAPPAVGAIADGVSMIPKPTASA
jgi:hypothetical protein